MTSQSLRQRLYGLQLLMDGLSIWIAVAFATMFLRLDGPDYAAIMQLRVGGTLTIETVLSIAAVLTFTALAAGLEAYGVRSLSSVACSVRRALSALGIVAGSMMVLSALMATVPLPRTAIMAGLVSASVLIVANRAMMVDFVRRYWAGQIVAEILIVDDGEVMIVDGEDRSSLPTPEAFRQAHRYGDIGACQLMDARDEGLEASLEDPQVLNRLGMILNRFDRAVVSCTAEKRDAWAMLLKGANIRGEIMLPGLNTVGAAGLGDFAGCATLIVSRGPASVWTRMFKRLLDICCVVPLLIVMIPILVVAAIVIRIESSGPTLVRRSRVGRGGRSFEIAVFRCTRVDAGGRNVLTVSGRIMRRAGIDRLPMFLNVLVGEMSMVGPRLHHPEPVFGARSLRVVERDYWQRHALKPGIVAHSDVAEGQAIQGLSARLNADHDYVGQWSAASDILRIGRAAAGLVRRRMTDRKVADAEAQEAGANVS